MVYPTHKYRGVRIFIIIGKIKATAETFEPKVLNEKVCNIIYLLDDGWVEFKI